jgi:Zn-dependent protease with chaperone function
MTVFTAFYLDGQSSKQKTVTVRIAGNLLLLDAAPPGTEAVAEWKLSETVIEKEYNDADKSGVLSNRQYKDARLVVSDRNAYHAVIAKLGRPHAFTIPFTLKTLLSIFVICAVFMAGGYMYVQHESEMLAPMIPQAYQRKIADVIIGAMDETKSRDGCNSKATLARLQKVTSKITLANHLKTAPRLVIIGNHDVNAFALPGDVIAVNEGLLEQAESAEEFAGVMAHEMGHLKHFHPQEALLHELGINLFSLLTIGTSDIRSAPQLVLWAQELSYSREKENQADAEGAVFLKAANINPEGMAKFLKREGARHASGIVPDGEWGKYFSDHPDSNARADLFRADKKAKYAPAMDALDWTLVKITCKK